MAPVAICSVGVTVDCNWVPLVVIESRSWGSILILVLSIVILSFAL